MLGWCPVHSPVVMTGALSGDGQKLFSNLDQDIRMNAFGLEETCFFFLTT